MAERPARYLAETGMPQLSGGLIMLVLGGSVLIQSLALIAPAYRDYGLILQYAALGCVGIVLWRLAALRQGVVFPRGGYVRPRGSGQTYLQAILIGLAGLAYSALSDIWPRYRIGLESRLLWPAFAMLFAAICLASGQREKSASTMWFGAYMACLAPLLWWLPMNNYARSGAFELAVGAPLAVTGAFRLREFVRAHPMPKETGDE